MVSPDPGPALEAWGGCLWGGASCSRKEAGEDGGGFLGSRSAKLGGSGPSSTGV